MRTVVDVVSASEGAPGSTSAFEAPVGPSYRRLWLPPQPKPTDRCTAMT